MSDLIDVYAERVLELLNGGHPPAEAVDKAQAESTTHNASMVVLIDRDPEGSDHDYATLVKRERDERGDVWERQNA